MKRIYKTLLLALTLNAGIAQTAFWTPTSYKGAFDCTTAMWTNGWTEWDPQNATYPTATQTISSNITTNTTWTTGQTYLLQGTIFVKNNAVLTIQPGVFVLGDKGTAGSCLVVTKGAQLQAVGTASQPIVFTTNQPAGASNRNVGDWGGIVLLGKAVNNIAGGIGNVEGLPVSADSEYGVSTGSNDADNSGTLKYVRIEFGGYVFAPNKEINGLTMGSVGNATSLDYIQCSFTNDDGFEWFGGTVNAKHLVSYRNLDDDFDTDNGYRGNVQFGLIVRDPNLADAPAVSTSEGFESDNDPTGSTNTPITSALFSNITAIGPYRGSSTTILAPGYRRGARIRRNSQLKIMNSIFMDFKTAGLHIDGSACEANAAAGTLKFSRNIVAQTAGVPAKALERNTASTFSITAWFALNNNDSLTTSAGILVNPYPSVTIFTGADYRPVCTNTLVNSGANFLDPVFASGGVLSVNALKNAASTMVLYPNPTSGQSNLYISSESSFDVSVSIYNVTGQLVNATSNHTVEKGYNVIPVNTDNLANGIYFVTVINNDKKETIKLIVNN